MRYWRVTWVTVMWAGLTLLPALGASPKRVLIVHSFSSTAPPFTTLSTAFESTLTEDLGEQVDLDEVSLDMARYAQPEMEDAFVEFLHHRLTKWQPDLVVPIGSPAGRFVAQYRAQLFPQTCVLYSGMEQRLLPPDALQTNAAYVGQSIDLPGLAEDILRLAPHTTNVVVVIGASAIERFWTAAMRRGFEPFTNLVSFTYVNDVPFDRMLEYVAKLPPRSFVLLPLLVRDVSGVTLNQDNALRRLHAAANAPINGIWHHQLGLGIVGGRLYDAETIGVESARVAIRILRGEPASSIPPQIVPPSRPRYDWRELQRWKISEDGLPPGSKVLFREPTVWGRYREWFIAGMLVCGLQALLIITLSVNRMKRLRAEMAARDFGGRLIKAHEEERARLARELHDDVTQRLAMLAIDAGLAERALSNRSQAEAIRGLRDGLGRLSEDVHALSYQLHPSILEDLGLVDALRAECENFSRRESIPAEFKLVDSVATVPNGVAICLYRVTQEALRNVARHAGARAAEVSLERENGGLHLAVWDDGSGFDPTVERGHPSLGLASMRERVRVLGGELRIDSARGRGTVIMAWVPLNGEST